MNTPNHSNLTLRDWFAGQALAGIINSAYVEGPNGPMLPRDDLVARWAYEYADALLAEREGGAR